jgi:hypothetical protein
VTPEPTCARGGVADERLSSERLSAYLDGDLPAAEFASLRQHLEGCPACSRRAGALAGVARAARSLDAPEPPPTLWSAIEGALERRPWWDLGARTFGLGALAGAAVAVVAVLGVGALRSAPHGPAAGAPAVAVVEAPAPRASVDPLLVEAEAEFARAAAAYERSIEKLRHLVARQEGAWSPDARARYADRLARLDEAIARSREAARRTPADSVGNEQLFAAYQQKITFLAEAVERGGGAAGRWSGEGAP